MIKVKRVNPIEEWDDAISLIKANWSESNQPIEFNADDARRFYEYLYENSALFAIGAYQLDELVGYCLVSVVPHPFNQSVKM